MDLFLSWGEGRESPSLGPLERTNFEGILTWINGTRTSGSVARSSDH
jgi:hypothetical protein